MKILILGVNHRTANVETRERLAFNGPRLEEGLRDLRALAGVSEAAVLSTCNRVELYTAAEDLPSTADRIREFLSSFHAVPRASFENALYQHTDTDAVKHVFRVASSLDSMVLGEPQILGQIKDAFEFALNRKTTGTLLNKLMKKAFSTAKRVRTETRIAENAVSISFAAVELAKKIFTELSSKSFMLLGAGDMAELAARHLVNNGVTDVRVANRTYERGCELAREFCGRPVRFEDFVDELSQVDILICSTGASTYVLTRDQMQRVMKQRKHRPVFIIDITVPRNVDPEINKLDNVYLYDIDDLQQVVDTNVLERKKEADKAEGIVGEEVEKFMKWMTSLESVPTIIALRQRADEIRTEEFRKFSDKHPELDDRHLKAVEYLCTAIVNKLIHPPTVALKEDADDRGVLAAAIKRLYGLNGDEK